MEGAIDCVVFFFQQQLESSEPALLQTLASLFHMPVCVPTSLLAPSYLSHPCFPSVVFSSYFKQVASCLAGIYATQGINK